MLFWISLLIIFLIFILLLLFLKSWQVHIIFHSDNTDYDYSINITFLFFNMEIVSLIDSVKVKLQFKWGSKLKNLFIYIFDKSQKGEVEESNDDIEAMDEEVDSNIFLKIKNTYPFLLNAKEDLLHIMKLIINIFTFEESYANINLGLYDNNLTIKFCNLLWALTAPLYPLKFRVTLTPEINQYKLLSNINVKFNFRLFNILVIIFNIITKENLRILIEEIGL